MKIEDKFFLEAVRSSVTTFDGLTVWSDYRFITRVGRVVFPPVSFFPATS